jgi:ubiquinol-cytochrome c reductase subunit 7
MASLAPYVLKRPWLAKMLQPVAAWYTGAAGYRQMGLRYVFTRDNDIYLRLPPKYTTAIALGLHRDLFYTEGGARRQELVVRMAC